MKNDFGETPITFAFFGLPRHLDVMNLQLSELAKVTAYTISVKYYVERDLLNEEQLRLFANSNLRVIIQEKLDEGILHQLDSEYGKREDLLRVNSGGLKKATLWRQLINISTALEDCENDQNIIIRSRTDVLISSESILRLIKLMLDKENNQKIWVQWASATIPFYMHDGVFAGRVSSLRRYINKKNMYKLSVFYPPYAFPSFFWIGPYVDDDISEWMKSDGKLRPKIFKVSEKYWRKTYFKYIKALEGDFLLQKLDIKWTLSYGKNEGIMVERIWDLYDNSIKYSLALFLFKFKYKIRAFEDQFDFIEFKIKNKKFIEFLKSGKISTLSTFDRLLIILMKIKIFNR